MAGDDRGQGQLWGGLLLIALGVLFLADQMNLLRFGRLMSTYWPMILVALGLIFLLKRPPNVVGGMVLLAIGAIFQGQRLGYFPWWWSMRRMWPLIPIAIGVAMLIERMRRPVEPPAAPPSNQLSPPAAP